MQASDPRGGGAAVAAGSCHEQGGGGRRGDEKEVGRHATHARHPEVQGRGEGELCKSFALKFIVPFLWQSGPAASTASGGSALNDLVDLNFGGGAPAQVPGVSILHSKREKHVLMSCV